MGKRKNRGNEVQKNAEEEIAQPDVERLKDLEKENELLNIERLYLEPVMDLYSDEILAFSISDHPTVVFALKPLHEALERLPEHHYRTYVHTDQRFQYQNYAWRKELKTHHVYQNMSRKATCLDNAQMESFFHLMKAETVASHHYQTREELETAMRVWIKYYNESRIKEKLGGQSPIEYRISTTEQVA